MSNLPDWSKTYQVAVVVNDIEAAKKHYEAAGIGPFKEGPSQVALDRKVYGKPAPDVEVKGVLAQMGPIELEIFQPIKGNSIQAEMLKKYGEGAIHLCAYTENFEAESAAMIEAGFPVISSGRFSDGGRFAYFDTRTPGGLILELFQTGDVYK